MKLRNYNFDTLSKRFNKKGFHLFCFVEFMFTDISASICPITGAVLNPWPKKL